MPETPLPHLRADCTRCFALCCVAPAFTASAAFAITKDAGRPCPNLAQDFRCGIHTRLRERGFAGCTVYDCFGAGQQVSQVTFGGQDWRQAPQTAQQMFSVFPIIEVKDWRSFTAKIVSVLVLTNLIGLAIYAAGRRRVQTTADDVS